MSEVIHITERLMEKYETKLIDGKLYVPLEALLVSLNEITKVLKGN